MKSDKNQDATFSEVAEIDLAREKIGSQIRDVLKHVGFFVLAGLVIGTGLVVGASYLGPEREGAHAVALLIVHELGMGFIVAAIAVFGYELLVHVSGAVNESRHLHAGFVSLDLATKQLRDASDLAKAAQAVTTALKANTRGVTGLDPDTAFGVLSVVERCAANRPCTKKAEVDFTLGPVGKDGNRQILVEYKYHPLSWIDRRLRFRCAMPETPSEATPIIDSNGYEVSWSFLGNASQSGEIPADAFVLDEVSIERQGTTEKLKFTTQCGQTSIECTTNEEVRALTPSDRVVIRFRILQADRFRFVSHTVRDCVTEYTARCATKHDTTDVIAIYPTSHLAASNRVRISTAHHDPRQITISTPGWVLPGGGVSFSWSTAALPNSADTEASELKASHLGIAAAQLSEGRFAYLGNAIDAVHCVTKQLATTIEAFNTFIAWDAPYPKKTRDDLELTLAEYIRRDDTRYEETCSEQSKGRVDRLKVLLDGSLPDSYEPRVLRKESSGVPACNFIILRHGANAPIREEVFFGWGFFKGSNSESVFWSTDSHLISFFREYHKALRNENVSEAYKP